MPKTTTASSTARKRTTASTNPGRRAKASPKANPARVAPVIFVGARSRADQPVRVRAYVVDAQTGQLTDVDLPADLVGRTRTFFSPHDGGVPPIVIVTPPPPRGPGGDELRQLAAQVRERAANVSGR